MENFEKKGVSFAPFFQKNLKFFIKFSFVFSPLLIFTLERRIHTAEDLIAKQKEVIEELTDIQKQSEDAAMNEMHGYMSDTKVQFENMRKKLKDKEIECGR